MNGKRRRGGRTISKTGQRWTLPAQLEQLNTRENGKVGVAKTSVVTQRSFKVNAYPKSIYLNLERRQE